VKRPSADSATEAKRERLFKIVDTAFTVYRRMRVDIPTDKTLGKPRPVICFDSRSTTEGSPIVSNEENRNLVSVRFLIRSVALRKATRSVLVSMDSDFR
jgi:hypothetical protein